MPVEENDLAEVLRRIDSHLIEILGLIKFRDSSVISTRILEVLNTPQKKRAYELTDGVRGRKELAQITKISERTISSWWSEWVAKGLLTRDQSSGRPRKIFSLEDFGIANRGIQTEVDSGEGLKEESLSPAKITQILQDPDVFPNLLSVVEFAEPILGVTFEPEGTKQDLIERIVSSVFQSPTMKRQLFMQALEQRLRKDKASFQKYFEFWERNIKG